MPFLVVLCSIMSAFVIKHVILFIVVCFKSCSNLSNTSMHIKPTGEWKGKAAISHTIIGCVRGHVLRWEIYIYNLSTETALTANNV